MIYKEAVDIVADMLHRLVGEEVARERARNIIQGLMSRYQLVPFADDEEALLDAAARLDGLDPSTWLHMVGIREARRLIQMYGHPQDRIVIPTE